MNTTITKTLASGILILAISYGGAAKAMPQLSRTQPTAAVLDLDPHNTSVDDTVIVSQYVRNEVVKSKTFRVVEKQKMDWLLREQAFQLTGCTSTDCAVSAGRLLNVKYIIFGAYSVYADYRIITSQIVDVETGQIIASDSETVYNISRVAGSAEALVKRILETAESAEPAPASGPRESILFPSARDEEATADLPRGSSPWKWLTMGIIMAAVFVGVVAAAN
jgi:TolB-like protein